MVFCAADEWQMHFMNLLNFIISVSLMRVSNKHINECITVNIKYKSI